MLWKNFACALLKRPPNDDVDDDNAYDDDADNDVDENVDVDGDAG